MGDGVTLTRVRHDAVRKVRRRADRRQKPDAAWPDWCAAASAGIRRIEQRPHFCVCEIVDESHPPVRQSSPHGHPGLQIVRSSSPAPIRMRLCRGSSRSEA